MKSTDIASSSAVNFNLIKLLSLMLLSYHSTIIKWLDGQCRCLKYGIIARSWPKMQQGIVSFKANSVRFHESHTDNYVKANNGNSWHKPILKSVQVNFIRLQYANQTPIRTYANRGISVAEMSSRNSSALEEGKCRYIIGF